MNNGGVTDVQTVTANGIEIAYETFGDPADPPILLVMGLGTQMIAWPDPLCEDLAGRGFHVIRFASSTSSCDAASPRTRSTTWPGTLWG